MLQRPIDHHSALIFTMVLVSALIFLLMEVLGRNISVQVLGVFATPEQYASYDNQLGLDEPAWQRYLDWVAGSDWRAAVRTEMRIAPVDYAR